ncbi:MAG: PAS domain S-box protein, partial [Ignavibacteriae bacterium]|nr:PAS domain S-box protein [Ignavibacteriota bacterium]
MTKEITDPKVIKPPQAMLFRLDLNLNVTEVSNNFYKLLGYTKKETIGNSILSTVHKDDRSKIKSIIDSLLTKHTQIATYEARKIKKDNSEIWVRAFIQILEPVKNKKEILITCEDITADIKNSERVKKLHECFLNFGSDADKNIDIIIKAISDLFDASCATYVKKNNKILCACSHLKYYCKNNKNNLLKSNFYKKVIRSSPPKVIYIKDLQKSILDKNDEIVVDNMLKSFLGKAISLNNQNIGALCIMFQNTFILNEDDLKFLEILVSAISVEETRFKSQLTIIENEKRFRSLLENSTIGIFRTTPNGKVIFANSKLVNLLGYSSLEELTQIDVPKKIYANPNSRKKIKNILEKEDSIKDYLEIFKKKDGTLIHVKENARVIRDENTNKVLFYEGTLEDITTQKRFETALINSEERFRSIFTNSGSGIVITNNKNYFIEANPKFCELLGYTKDELLKMTFFDITYPDDIKKSKKVITELHKGIKKNIHVQKRYVRKDGKIIWGSITVGFYSSELNNEYNQVGIFEDITESVTNLLKLNARDKILSALSFSTETFLKTLDWHANINEVLKRLGESLEASRCYIFQNHVSKSKEILTSQKYEWVAKNISPEINNPIMQNMSFKKIGLSELLVALKANKIFTKLTKDFNPKAKQFFEAQNIKSVLLVPIFESDKPWGFIGFDDCVNERIWSKQETEALSTAGNLFGVAIKRKIFEEELLKAKINAEEATELKSQFLAQISHEIRSP